MTLRPIATSCAKDYKGHSLVQTSFTKPPNSHKVRGGGRERPRLSTRAQSLFRSCRWISVCSLSSRFWRHQYTSAWRGWDLGFHEGRSFLELRVINVCVMKNRVLFNDYENRSCVENKETWRLWNTEWDRSWLRGVAVDTDRLSAVCKVSLKEYIEGSQKTDLQ